MNITRSLCRSLRHPSLYHAPPRALRDDSANSCEFMQLPHASLINVRKTTRFRMFSAGKCRSRHFQIFRFNGVYVLSTRKYLIMKLYMSFVHRYIIITKFCELFMVSIYTARHIHICLPKKFREACSFNRYTRTVMNIDAMYRSFRCRADRFTRVTLMGSRENGCTRYFLPMSANTGAYT